MQHVEVPVPTPKKDELLLKLEATSLNPVDWKIQKGILRPILPRKFPHIPGNSLLPVVPLTEHISILQLQADTNRKFVPSCFFFQGTGIECCARKFILFSFFFQRTRIEYCAFPLPFKFHACSTCYDAFLIRCKNVFLMSSNLNDTSFSLNMGWRVAISIPMGVTYQ